jgi:hypothetical protein
MKNIIVMTAVMLVISGCTGEYADEGVQKMNTMSDADNPELSIGRDMLAVALRYDIDQFVERNRPRLEDCFLDILGENPSDELLARLEGTKLKVHKFSEWTTFYKDENGSPVIPRRFFTISVRDVRIIDSTHMEVDTAWNASGNDIPGETFYLERIEGTWRVIRSKLTP